MGNGQPRTEPAARRRGTHAPGSWRAEVDDFVRAFSGAFVVATPLLYTTEMWLLGVSVERGKLLLFLAVAVVISLGLARSRTGGFREGTSGFAVVEQAIDGVAVGLVGALVVLLVLNRIAIGDPLDSIVGKVAIQAVPLAIGAAVANAIFGPDRQGGRQGDDGDGDAPATAGQALRSDLGATIVGALFIAITIAPTDEIAMLAAGMDVKHELALVVLSLVLTYTIVFASGLGEGQHEQPGPFQHPITETVLAYAVSLLVALATLYLFDRIGAGDSLHHVVTMVLVLGLPAAVGGAAGRLVV